jgi:hypothetical protein
MHDFSIVDLGGLVAAGWVLVRILGPIAGALARRIDPRTPAPTATATDPAIPRLEEELEQLHERLDFLERALASRPGPAELPRPRTPV